MHRPAPASHWHTATQQLGISHKQTPRSWTARRNTQHFLASHGESKEMAGRKIKYKISARVSTTVQIPQLGKQRSRVVVLPYFFL